MSETSIPWCDYTWNPWRGCDKVSAGCKYCYIVLTPPFRISGQKHGDPRVRGSDAVLKAPYGWNKRPWICDVCGNAEPDGSDDCRKCGSETGAFGKNRHRARVFLGSLMDIFDDEVKVEWLADALQVVNDCKDLDFLLVTKRPELWLQRLTYVLDWEHQFRGLTGFADHWLRGTAPENVWMITSTENQEMLEKREPELLKIPAVVHGLSCEPLLGPLVLQGPLNGEFKLYLRNLSDTDSDRKGKKRIDWVIAGGESGPNARNCNVSWIRNIQEQCMVAGVSYFGKQLGAKPVCDCSVAAGSHSANCCEHFPYPIRNKKGEDPTEWPADMRVRQWPSPRDSITSGSGGPGSPIAKASSAPSSTEDR